MATVVRAICHKQDSLMYKKAFYYNSLARFTLLCDSLCFTLEGDHYCEYIKMLRKRISCQKLKAGAYSSPPTYKFLNKCFICFVNGRHYSQGHASASQRVEADSPITPTNAEAPTPSVTNTDPDPSLVQQSETKSQIKFF
ncbi:hypothetical protein EB796_017432 [Bugula neritina]|uniref:Uncharacterized protein n=1 Tax=Bugula neritina TaxID=10212 RepID=A0A7J7JF90_BUGNE|nr:hypothetical protein EB796_017432 [Bugula neritina]